MDSLIRAAIHLADVTVSHPPRPSPRGLCWPHPLPLITLTPSPSDHPHTHQFMHVDLQDSDEGMPEGQIELSRLRKNKVACVTLPAPPSQSVG